MADSLFQGLVAFAWAAQVVTGQATLESRATLVPYALCEQKDGCPQSEPYWVLVVKDDAVTYELDERFGQGSREAPASVELVGTQIRPGATVMIEGRFRPVSNDYVYVDEVTRAGVLKETP